MRTRIPLEGRVFGRLTVLRFMGLVKQNPIWECRCKCGNTVLKFGAWLRGGQARRCNRTCGGKYDIGQKYDRLVITERIDTNHVGCLCQCGKTCVRTITYLGKKGVQNCGCVRKTIPPEIAAKLQDSNKRNKAILEAHNLGIARASIARLCGITRQRVHQVVQHEKAMGNRKQTGSNR